MFTLLESISLALIPAFLLLDYIWQARRYEKTRHWRLRGVLVTVAIFFFSGEIALLWVKLAGDFRLMDGSNLGIWGGAIFGIVVYEFLHYWYHRLAHQWHWLWLAGHQVHHSAESLDAFGAYYQHPFDAAMFTIIMSAVFFSVLGLVPEAGIIGVLFLTFNAMFQHANIKTPYWLGYFIQRPESHAIHHGKDVHQYNYSDLPLWDMVFGSFKNPRSNEVPVEAGFYKGASNRLIAMFLMQDINKPEQTSSLAEPSEVIRKAA